MTWLPNELGSYDFILFSSVDRVSLPKGMI